MTDKHPLHQQKTNWTQRLIETNGLAQGHFEGWLLYPNDDETVRFLARNKEQLEKYYRVTTPPWETVRFACEKRLTYELAEKCGIAAPRTFYPTSVAELEQMDIEFPVIIKPSVKEPFYSRMGKKAIRTDNKKELIDEFTRVGEIVGDSEIMIQEYIPGGSQNLYSVGSLCKNGELLAMVVARRLRQHPLGASYGTTDARHPRVALRWGVLPGVWPDFTPTHCFIWSCT